MTTVTKHYATADGAYIGAYVGLVGEDGLVLWPEIPPDAVEVAGPPEPQPVDLVAYAAEARWRARIAGIAVDGVQIAADDTSLVMLSGARIKAEKDASWTTQWAVGGSVVVPLTAGQVIAISDAVLAHVDATFATFGSVVAAIGAGTITTTAEIDAAFAGI